MIFKKSACLKEKKKDPPLLELDSEYIRVCFDSSGSDQQETLVCP